MSGATLLFWSVAALVVVVVVGVNWFRLKDGLSMYFRQRRYCRRRTSPDSGEPSMVEFYVTYRRGGRQFLAIVLAQARPAGL